MTFFHILMSALQLKNDSMDVVKPYFFIRNVAPKDLNETLLVDCINKVLTRYTNAIYNIVSLTSDSNFQRKSPDISLLESADKLRKYDPQRLSYHNLDNGRVNDYLVILNGVEVPFLIHKIAVNKLKSDLLGRELPPHKQDSRDEIWIITEDTQFKYRASILYLDSVTRSACKKCMTNDIQIEYDPSLCQDVVTCEDRDMLFASKTIEIIKAINLDTEFDIARMDIGIQLIEDELVTMRKLVKDVRDLAYRSTSNRLEVIAELVQRNPLFGDVGLTNFKELGKELRAKQNYLKALLEDKRKRLQDLDDHILTGYPQQSADLDENTVRVFQGSRYELCNFEIILHESSEDYCRVRKQLYVHVKTGLDGCFQINRGGAIRTYRTSESITNIPAINECEAMDIKFGKYSVTDMREYYWKYFIQNNEPDCQLAEVFVEVIALFSKGFSEYLVPGDIISEADEIEYWSTVLAIYNNKGKRIEFKQANKLRKTINRVLTRGGLEIKRGQFRPTVYKIINGKKERTRPRVWYLDYLHKEEGDTLISVKPLLID